MCDTSRDRVLARLLKTKEDSKKMKDATYANTHKDQLKRLARQVPLDITEPVFEVCTYDRSIIYYI